jgi:hypothetical protein
MNHKNICRTEKTNFQGWNAYNLSNGLIRLVAVPDIGGRIMAYDLGPYAYFFVDPDLAGKLFTPEENYGKGELADWKNYGGDKTWPAPQGWDNDEQWHGPPDPVLDTGRYRVMESHSSDGNASILMESPPDPVTGVQIRRRFQLIHGSSRVKVTLIFKNTKETPIRWGIWDVAQLRAERTLEDGSLEFEPECSVTTRINPNSKFENGFFVIAGDEDNPQWTVDEESGLFSGNYMWKIGKVGLDSDAGWIAFTNNKEGYAFSEQFAYESGAEYPDNGSSVECWTVGEGLVGTLDYSDSKVFLMETEVLAPMREIQPNAETSFEMEWGVCRINGKVRDVNEAGCIATPLNAVKKDGLIHLTGEFGVFDVGELVLVWLDKDSAELDVVALRNVSPLGVVSIDRLFSPPKDASVVLLQVKSAFDEKRYLLDKKLLS